MNKKDSVILHKKIASLLQDLVQRLKQAENENLLSVSLTGSTVKKELKYNQDVDLFVVLKKIKGENINIIRRDLKRIVKGGLDLLYKPDIPKVTRVFNEIVKKYTTTNTAVKYKFTLGNYWGKPVSGKKFTIHLHVLGPHTVKSLEERVNKFHKVILANAISNSKVLLGADLKAFYKIRVKTKDILSVLGMLKLRQKKALAILDSDPDLALQISIKNLVKIAMGTLEIFNIFENSAVKAGRLFKKRFNLPYNHLPEKVFEYKAKKTAILKNRKKVEEIVRNTDILLNSVIGLITKGKAKRK